MTDQREPVGARCSYENCGELRGAYVHSFHHVFRAPAEVEDEGARPPENAWPKVTRLESGVWYVEGRPDLATLIPPAIEAAIRKEATAPLDDLDFVSRALKRALDSERTRAEAAEAKLEAWLPFAKVNAEGRFLLNDEFGTFGCAVCDAVSDLGDVPPSQEATHIATIDHEPDCPARALTAESVTPGGEG